ncbi:MAG: hypothetical protein JNN01_11280, partial [Opitutaceae bacterium]|nr:hypothetical protein [Opitutaceae bacterium]
MNTPCSRRTALGGSIAACLLVLALPVQAQTSSSTPALSPESQSEVVTLS